MRMRFAPELSMIHHLLEKPRSDRFLEFHLLRLIEAAIMIAFIALVLAFPNIISVFALDLIKPSLILPGSAIANVTDSHYIYQCSGEQYGHNLDSTSCNDALSQIDISSTIPQTWGQRLTGPFDVKLPKRYISCSFLPAP